MEWLSKVAQYKSVAELEKEPEYFDSSISSSRLLPSCLLPCQHISNVLINMVSRCQPQSKPYLLSRRCPILQLCGGSMGSPDIPALSSSIQRDRSSLADGGCRDSSMDLALLPGSGRAGSACLVL